MNILPSRIFFQPAIVHVFSAFPKCLSLRWYSTITRQEFGRHFEELVVQSLRKYSFDVAVCGGPKDRGIDFRGVWHLKVSSVPVIGQCRRYKKRLGPKHVRELVGTLTHEVKGTLGIIVTECGYSKDAYGLFMGSLYPIVLSTLQGYSDDLLQWYFDHGNNEMCVNEHQDIIESNSVQIIEKECSSKNTQAVDRNNDYCNSSYFEGMSNKGVINTQKINCLHQSSAAAQGEVKGSLSNENIRAFSETTESNTSATSDQCVQNHLRTKLVHNGPLANVFTDVNNNFEQSTSLDISDIASGVITMFELNPAAQKLLPNLVVGMKYRRRNSKVPELFINEDDLFVSLPK